MYVGSHHALVRHGPVLIEERNHALVEEDQKEKHNVCKTRKKNTMYVIDSDGQYKEKLRSTYRAKRGVPDEACVEACRSHENHITNDKQSLGL